MFKRTPTETQPRAENELFVRREPPAPSLTPVEHVEETTMKEPRGRLSLGAVLTGAVTAFGAMIVLGAVIAGALMLFAWLRNEPVRGDTAFWTGAVVGVGLAIGCYIAVAWGSYTAGRMAGGFGVMNGMFVTLFTLIGAGAMGLAAWRIGSWAHMDWINQRIAYELQGQRFTYLAVGVGAASVLAMVIAGVAGGARGAGKTRRMFWRRGSGMDVSR